MTPEKKKKIMKISGIAAGSLLVLLLATFLCLNVIVKYSVRAAAPLLLGTDVSIKLVDLRPFSGTFELGDIRIGNPKFGNIKFSSPEVLHVKKVFLKIDMRTLLSSKIRVNHLLVKGVDVYYESTAMIIHSNVSILNDNVKKLSGDGGAKPAAKSSGPAKQTKLQVDDLDLEDINTHLVLGGDAVLPVPNINFDNLGTGPDGITPGNLISDILNQITIGTLNKIGSSAGEAGKAVISSAGNLIDSILGGKKNSDAKKTVPSKKK